MKMIALIIFVLVTLMMMTLMGKLEFLYMACILIFLLILGYIITHYK